MQITGQDKPLNTALEMTGKLSITCKYCFLESKISTGCFFVVVVGEKQFAIITV